MNDLAQAAKLVTAKAAGLKLYARQWLDAQQADDAVQDALTALLSQRNCPNDPVTWMYTAVRNAAIDQVRSCWRRRRREQHVARGRPEWFAPLPDAAIDAQSVQRALEQLPRELREIVVLRIWGGLGYVEIARIAQVSVGTAHQRFADAINRLREALE